MVTGAITTTLSAYAISTAQTGSGGSSQSAALTPVTTLVLAAGQVLKDMGKTITTGAVGTTGATAAPVAGLGPRVFRKVQLLNQGRTVANGTINVANGVGSGYLGTDTGSFGSGYNTFYIELPTSGTPVASVAAFANLVYIPGVPGFAF